MTRLRRHFTRGLILTALIFSTGCGGTVQRDKYKDYDTPKAAPTKSS